MPKLPIKAAPLALAVQAAMVLRDHWSALKPADREELTRLLRTSQGRPSNLSAAEKQELRRLVGKLDLPGLGRNLAPVVQQRGGRRRRW